MYHLVDFVANVMVLGMGMSVVSPALAQAPGREELMSCGRKCRGAFEMAARAHFGPDPGEAGTLIGLAQRQLYNCLGRRLEFHTAFSEVERWFSFFSLWWAARLLGEGEVTQAVEILGDQLESYSPERARSLGILQDYGFESTRRLYDMTFRAYLSAQRYKIAEARKQADQAADFQYWLAVQRCGVPAPHLWMKH